MNDCKTFKCDNCQTEICVLCEYDIHPDVWELGVVDKRVACSEDCWFKLLNKPI